MDRPAIAGNGGIRRCTSAKFETDPTRLIDQHLDLLLVPPSVQSIGEFFIDAKIRKIRNNLLKSCSGSRSLKVFERKERSPESVGLPKALRYLVVPV